MLSSTFRAYTQAASSTSFTQKDEDGNPVLDRKGIPVRTTREWLGQEVAFTGETSGDKAEFDAGEVVVSQVVFYDADEVVVGSVDVNGSGSISVACPDPEAD